MHVLISDLATDLMYFVAMDRAVKLSNKVMTKLWHYVKIDTNL